MQTNTHDTDPGTQPKTETAEPEKHTIYVLVRQDISIEQQLVQSAHAAAEAARSHYRDGHGIASLIVLSVPDRFALYKARDRLLAKGILSEIFFEPDFGMGHSALATEPLTNAQRRHLRSWSLWTLEKALKRQELPAPSASITPLAQSQIIQAIAA
jgi:hypothetical protein